MNEGAASTVPSRGGDRKGMRGSSGCVGVRVIGGGMLSVGLIERDAAASGAGALVGCGCEGVADSVGGKLL